MYLPTCYTVCALFDAYIHVAAADHSPELDPIEVSTIVLAQYSWTVHYTDLLY